MSRRRVALVILLAMLAVPAAGRRSQETDSPVELRSDLVLVPVAVRKIAGGAITDLATGDFSLEEDGVVQQIEVFRHDTAPVDAVLLLDSSASVETSEEAMRRAVRAFLEELRPEDRVSLVTFADTPRIALEWTSDRTAVVNAVSATKAGGGTTLYGSVVAALCERFGESDSHRRRAMVILTDGVDTLSTTTSRAAARVAQRKDTAVYVVSTGRIIAETTRIALKSIRMPPRERARRLSGLGQLARAEEGLEHLAAQSGGRVLYPRAVGDLRRAYGEIAGEIRSRYLLGYYPTSTGKGEHTIGVSTRRREASVHARRGYSRE